MSARIFVLVLIFLSAGLSSGPLAFAQDKAPEKDAPAASVKETPVDLREILKWTYDTNPTLKAAREELKAVQEEMPQALAGWKPTIDATGDLTSEDIDGSNAGDGTTSKDLGLALSQPVYRGGQTRAAVDQARNTIYAQRAVLVAAEESLLLDVATAYMDVVRDQALLDLAKNNENVLQEELKATRTRFEVGELTRTDVSQAEARLADARSNKIGAMGDLQSSLASYEQLVGLPAKGMLGYPDMKFPVPETLAEAQDYADNHNPNIIAARYLHESAKNNIRQIYGELLPELAFVGNWERSYDPQPGILDKTTERAVGLTATIPLYEAGGTRSRVRQAKHVANQRFLESIEVKREIRQQVISNWEALRTAVAEIESRKAQVDAAEVAWQGVKEEASLGSRTVLDVLNASQEVQDAKVALVTARRNEVVAEFALAETLGLLTPKVLGFQDYGQEFEDQLERIKWKILGTDVENEGSPP